MMERFETLYRDQRPRYEQFPLHPDPSGQQMLWILSDYKDFLEQALSTKAKGVLRAVISELFGAGAVCIRSGDVGALTLFLDLAAFAWRAIESDDELGRNFVALRDQLLGNTDSLVTVTVAVAPGRDSQRIAIPGLLARLAKLYSEFMKAAVDNESTVDLAAAAEHLLDSFAIGSKPSLTCRERLRLIPTSLRSPAD